MSHVSAFESCNKAMSLFVNIHTVASFHRQLVNNKMVTRNPNDVLNKPKKVTTYLIVDTRHNDKISTSKSYKMHFCLEDMGTNKIKNTNAHTNSLGSILSMLF